MYDATDPRRDVTLRSLLLHGGYDLVAGAEHDGLDLIELKAGCQVLHVGDAPPDPTVPVLARTDGDTVAPDLPHGSFPPQLALRLAVAGDVELPPVHICPTIDATYDVARIIATRDHAVDVTAVGVDGARLQLGPWVEDHLGLAVRWHVSIGDDVDVAGVADVPVTGPLRPGTHERLLATAGLLAGTAACAVIPLGCPDPRWRIADLTHSPRLTVDPDRWLAAVTGPTDDD